MFSNTLLWVAGFNPIATPSSVDPPLISISSRVLFDVSTSIAGVLALTCQVHRLGIKHVIVHPDQAGDNRVAGKGEHLRTRRNRRRARVSDRRDGPVAND